MKIQEDIDILLIRLFSDEANSEEKRKIEEWLGQSAENKKLYADLREIWLSSGIPSNSDNYQLENAISQFREKIRNWKGQQKRLAISAFLKYAAVVVLVLALPFSYYLGTRTNHQQSSMTTISCAFGDRTSIILPDSSKVWLNSGSSLSFDPDFRQENRDVVLEGEAFFSVAKDKLHPFHVKTPEIDIVVLGTQFNVKAYADENIVSTTLVEGSVHITSKFQNTDIKPFEKIIFDKKSQKMVLHKLEDTSPETEWKDGRLIFRNESLEELKPKLERWFDVDIVFGDELVKNRRFTGVLERESILEAISYFDLSKLVQCRIEGNKIIIKSENN